MPLTRSGSLVNILLCLINLLWLLAVPTISKEARGSCLDRSSAPAAVLLLCHQLAVISFQDPLQLQDSFLSTIHCAVQPLLLLVLIIYTRKKVQVVFEALFGDRISKQSVENFHFVL